MYGIGAVMEKTSDSWWSSRYGTRTRGTTGWATKLFEAYSG